MLLPSRDPTLTEARTTTRRVGRTFGLAARLLPAGVRDDVHLLYLVLRTLDDLGDEDDPTAEDRVAAVEAWATADSVRSPEARVLQRLALRHDLPREAVLDFCAGMRHDLEGRVVHTEEDLERYCHQVAGTVGLMMVAILGLRAEADPRAARAAAATLGMAMQRTNVLRDIDEDAARRRVYVPADAIARHGGLAPGRRAALLREQIAAADARYEVGLAGIDALAGGRTAIRAAALMYREILRQIERDGLGVRPGRAVVPMSRKARLVVAAARSG